MPAPIIINTIDLDQGIDVNTFPMFDPVTGHVFAFANDGKLFTIDARTGRRLWTSTPYITLPNNSSYDVPTLMLSTPRGLLFSANQDGTLLIMDIRHGAPRTLRQVQLEVAPLSLFAIDEQRSVLVTSLGPAWYTAALPRLDFLSIPTGKVEASILLDKRDIVLSVNIDEQTGRALAVVERQKGTAPQWLPGPQRILVLDTITHRILHTYPAPAAYTSVISDPVSRTVLFQSTAGVVEVRDSRTGALLRTIRDRANLLVLVGRVLVALRTGYADLRSVATGQLLASLPYRGTPLDFLVDQRRGLAVIGSIVFADKTSMLTTIDVAHRVASIRTYIDPQGGTIQIMALAPTTQRIFLVTETNTNTLTIHLVTVDELGSVLRPLPPCGC